MTRRRTQVGRVPLLDCQALDIEAWRKANRVPVFPGKINRWLLARDGEDNASEGEIRADLLDTIVHWESVGQWGLDSKWFYWDFGNAARIGNFDLIEVKRVSSDRFSIAPNAARREQLPLGPLPMVGGNRPLYVEMSFAYRGSMPDLPWPTALIPPPSGGIFPAYYFCPIGAHWILLAAGQPLQDAPTERSTIDYMSDVGAAVTGSALQVLFWPLALVAGVGGVLHFTRRQISK